MRKQILAIFLIGSMSLSPAIAQQTMPSQEQPAAATQIEQNQAEPEPPNHATRIAPHRALVPAYTALKFALVAPLSSTTAKPGDDVQLRLLRPLTVDDNTILANGTIVHGKVTKVKKPETRCKDASLEWEVKHVEFPDGSQAATKIALVKSDTQAVVPYQMPLDGIGVGTVIGATLAVPIAAPVLVVFGALNGPYFLARWLDGNYENDDTCPGTGKEVDLPAGALVAVVLKKNHKVRY